MHTHRIKVLHVTDSNAVVIIVAHNLILDLFPMADVLLNQDLGDHALR